MSVIANIDEPGGHVMIVEDHELLAQSLAFALRGEDFRVTLVFHDSGEKIVREAEVLSPDIVLLDLNLGEKVGSGLPLIPPLNETGAQVLILTAETDRTRLAECVEAGAAGIVTKNQSFERLVDAVREAATMHSLLTEMQRDDLLAELRRQRDYDRRRLAPFSRLTAREQQVLGALMDGLSAEAIAGEWVVSLATVRSQIRSVLQKLEVNSQLAAVARARHAGWMPPES